MGSNSGNSLKWRKYLKLVEFGFTTLDELRADIARYPAEEADHLVRDIASRRRKESEQRHLYVVKLVTANLQGQLQNYRIQTNSDFRGLAQFLKANKGGQHDEVWFCRTRVDDQVFSVAGRVVFARESGPQAQVIEQLWRCSPRLLETFSRKSACAYCRGSRCAWGWPYKIEQTHVPPGSDLKTGRLVEEFRYSLRMLEGEREKIQVFNEFLDSFCFPAYSLEYKIVGAKLSVIDWDTPNDKRVLATEHS